jgi:hypothetical protein
MEVVLLEATSLDALELTHGRYFGVPERHPFRRPAQA